MSVEFCVFVEGLWSLSLFVSFGGAKSLSPFVPILEGLCLSGRNVSGGVTGGDTCGCDSTEGDTEFPRPASAKRLSRSAPEMWVLIGIYGVCGTKTLFVLPVES